ncbi:hypothetical protein ACFPIJ_06960 [Dactylosporangium cerinum]|uniref:Methyltransferase domain-containing protein n=1 Tax=Dactylosporangium cerinum TaxID=1434730 RepID=A0ABV9VNA9_9ACTN
MTYHLIDEPPPTGTIAHVTFVAFLPGGACAALPGPALMGGAVLPGESIDLDASVRIPLRQAGFRRQRVRAFALDGTHLFAWLYGDHRPRRHPAGPDPVTATPAGPDPATATPAGIHEASDPPDHVTATPAGVNEDSDPLALVTATPDLLADALDRRGLPLQARAVRDAAAAFGTAVERDYSADALRLLEPAYLRADTLEAGSGFGGTSEQWRACREMIVDGIDRDGTFLDVGCANGLLMESVQRWAAERGHHIEPYGIDLGPRLAAAARARLPHWADRIGTGNAMDHVPAGGRRFTFTHVIVDLAPAGRLADLLRHALRTYVEPGGRLLVSRYAPVGGTDRTDAAEIVRGLGFPVVGVAHARGGNEAGSTAWVDRPR